MPTHLTAVYDLEVSPSSYDIATFLISAETVRVRLKLQEIKLLVVSGPNNGFRPHCTRTHSENITFLENVIKPITSLMPSVIAFIHCTRADAMNFLRHVKPNELFPRGFKLETPATGYNLNHISLAQILDLPPPKFKTPVFAEELADQFIRQLPEGQGFITLTTREISRENPDNTRSIDFAAWQTAIDILKNRGILTVVIRDTHAAFTRIPMFKGAIEIPEASLSVAFRLAIYERALINFAKNNGPTLLLYFSNTTSTVFFETSEEFIQLSEEYLEKVCGLTKGGQMPMTTKSKNILWQRETTDTILLEVDIAVSKDRHTNILHSFETSKQFKVLYEGALACWLRDIYRTEGKDEIIHLIKNDRDILFSLESFFRGSPLGEGEFYSQGGIMIPDPIMNRLMKT